MVRFTLSYGTPRSSRVMLKLLNLFSSVSNVFETFSSLQTTMKVVERTELWVIVTTLEETIVQGSEFQQLIYHISWEYYSFVKLLYVSRPSSTPFYSSWTDGARFNRSIKRHSFSNNHHVIRKSRTVSRKVVKRKKVE